MAVPDDTCSQCCTCPAPTVQWDSRGVSLAKCGFTNNGIDFFQIRKRCQSGQMQTSTYDFATCTFSSSSADDIRCCTNLFAYDGKKWAKRITTDDYEGEYNFDSGASGNRFINTDTRTGALVTTETLGADCVKTTVCEGVVSWDYKGENIRDEPNAIFWPGIGLVWGTFTDRAVGSVTKSGDCTCVYYEVRTFEHTPGVGSPTVPSSSEVFDTDNCVPADDGLGIPAASSTEDFADEVVVPDEELETPYTDEMLIENAQDQYAGFDGDWNDTPGSYRNLAPDGTSYVESESRYRLQFKIPTVGTGLCYRVSWVERYIAEAGVALTSAEIITRGVFRPAVSWSGGGGTGLELIAVMGPAGDVSAIRILNPGTGFTGLPTITVEDAINGGTSSTGWMAVRTGDQITAIDGGSGGDYLPTGEFSGGGGTGATIAFTLDETGGLATCLLGATGGDYTAEPNLTITPKVSGFIAALVHLHLGVETARCVEWDGITPEDYDPADPSTYPILGDGTNPYFSLAAPTSDGETLVANVVAVCNCTSCP